MRIIFGIVLLIGFSGVAVVGAVSLGQSATSAASASAASADSSRQAAQPWARRDAHDSFALGDPNAPIVLSEWVDFRCPYCAKFTTVTLPIIIEEYVDKGLVRWEFNALTLFGEHSVRAAVGAHAAAEQGRFFEHMNAAYTASPGFGGEASFGITHLTEHAAAAGIKDIDAFIRALEQEDLQRKVQADSEQAIAMGVPYFIVSSRDPAIDPVLVSGARPIEVFRQILDEALAKTQP